MARITIIRSRRRWSDFGWRELAQSRDLIGLFVWRDFITVYKQTILGPLWHLLQPLLTTLTFTLIFGRIARLPTDGAPPFLFYLSGTIAWTYFATCVTSTSDTLSANAHLFSKVYFPRLVVPIATVISRMVSFSIQLCLLLVAVVYYEQLGARVRLSLTFVLVPLLLAMLAVLSLALGTVLSSLTTRYRDLQYLVSFGISLLMFATPVIYPSSLVPPRYHYLVQLNPVAPVIEAFRSATLGTGVIDVRSLLVSGASALVLLLAGLVAFKRAEETFVDTV